MPSSVEETERRRSALRLALALTAAMIAAGLAWTCFALPLVLGNRGRYSWQIPGDVWIFVSSADYVAAGALPYLYEADPAYVYPPGIALLLAPVAAIGQRLGLSRTTAQVAVARPSMWLIVAPVGIATVLVPLRAGRRAVNAFASSLIGVKLELVIAALLVPLAILYGHYEEIVVLGLLLVAARLLAEGRFDGSALAIAGALLCKQTVLLVIPLYLLQVPRARVLRTALLALGPVALLCAICLVADWQHAGPALFRATSYPTYGHRALWVRGGDGQSLGGRARIVQVVSAVLIGVALRNRRAGAHVLAAMALLMLIRPLLEPVVFSYYVGVPAVLAVAATASVTRMWMATASAGAAATSIFLIHGSGATWWVPFATALLALAAGPVWVLCRGVPATSPASAGER